MKLHLGDCLEVLKGMESSSIDAVITDPPAGIAFMGKAWDHDKGGRRQWIAWLAEVLAECLRVAKPGSHLLCWALPRTSHWTGTAIEDAGWLIEDRITHHFGSGFPKGKAKLKPATEDWWLATKPGGKKWLNVDGCRVGTDAGWSYPNGRGGSEPHHMQRGQRNGIAGEPCKAIAGRWPANLVMSHDLGCVCRGTKPVASNGHYPKARGESGYDGGLLGQDMLAERYTSGETVADYECVEGCPVRLMGEQSGRLTSGKAAAGGHVRNGDKTRNAYAEFPGMRCEGDVLYGDTGTAARFFPNFDADPFIYQAKASRSDRGEGNTHPTVKSVGLMRWLCRLATPPGGVILDPFMGSGSTGKAATIEGFSFVGIEEDPQWMTIAERRIEAESTFSLESRA